MHSEFRWVSFCSSMAYVTLFAIFCLHLFNASCRKLSQEVLDHRLWQTSDTWVITHSIYLSHSTCREPPHEPLAHRCGICFQEPGLQMWQIANSRNIAVSAAAKEFCLISDTSPFHVACTTAADCSSTMESINPSTR